MASGHFDWIALNRSQCEERGMLGTEGSNIRSGLKADIRRM